MNQFKRCVRCVYDSTIPEITFDENGLCNFCRNYDRLAKKFVNIPASEKKALLNNIVSKIKRIGRNQKYDCILGLSGGVDSSYLAWLAKDLGLRPLVVHFDNGWNSELAVKNIENIVRTLDYDLETVVFNWEEFKDLQRAYFLADVVDIEVPTDYLIFAVLNRMAANRGIKYILSGYNFATEFGMPRGWNYMNKFDHLNLSDIHRRFGSVRLKSFPKFGRYQRLYYEKVLGIETVALLNYIDYVKNDVKEFIKAKFAWKDYGGKHYESVFTRFYQGYVLPRKFGIDKRMAHWSSLICSGQASQEEALTDLKLPPYPLDQQVNDFDYVAKKLGFSRREFEIILSRRPVPHENYAHEHDRDWKWTIFNKLMSFPIKVRGKFRHIGATGRW
jgi:N-acetyl sugar amidotransferase